MNWEALGAIGEIVGAVAVVLTLGYLAVQIRQNTRVFQSSTEQAQADAHTRCLSLIAQDPDLTRLYLRGASGDSLDREESLRFGFLLHVVFSQVQAAFFHYRQGTLSPEQWVPPSRVAAWWISSPGARAWWAEGKTVYREEFVQLVEGMIRRDE